MSISRSKIVSSSFLKDCRNTMFNLFNVLIALNALCIIRADVVHAPHNSIAVSVASSKSIQSGPPSLAAALSNTVSDDNDTSESDEDNAPPAPAPASVTRTTVSQSGSSSASGTIPYISSSLSSGSSSGQIQHQTLPAEPIPLPITITARAGLRTIIAPETITISQPTVAKIGEVVQNIPTAVSHQSQTVVHKHARVVTPIVAPAVRTVTTQVLRSYHTPLVFSPQIIRTVSN